MGVKKRRFLRETLLLALAAGMLLLPAMVNGFPFVFAADTSDYVILTPRVYRSPFYQAFVAFTGLRLSPWLPVIAQALLASGLIRLFLTMRGFGMVREFVIIMTVLTSLTGLSIFVGFIMPDVFTGLMFLGIFLLVFDWNRLSWRQRSFVACTCLLSISVHLSHLVMAVAMTLASGLFRIVTTRDPSALRGTGVAGLAIVGVAAAFFTYNVAVFHDARLSPAGSVFFMANLIEHGPVRDELAATCPSAGYQLCAYQDRLPPIANDLLWRDGPLRELGGFTAMREESGRIVSATLTHRPGAVIVASMRNVTRALGSVRPAADIVPTSTMPVIRAVIGKVYSPSAQRAFDASLQEQGRFPITLFDSLALAGLAGAGALLALLIAHGVRQMDRSALIFLGYAVAAFAGNAVVCATISGVWDRYQARVAWLPVLAVVTLALQAVQAAGMTRRTVRD